MEYAKIAWELVRRNVAKFVLLFVLGGLFTVVGAIPGTENVSNVLGNQINSIKATLGTDQVSPTVP